MRSTLLSASWPIPACDLSRLLAALFLALLVGLPAGALAQGLDHYRASGEIAERYDGYVEARGGQASKEVRKVVEDINRKRRQIYESRAREQDVPSEAVAKVYAKQIFQDAPTGTYFRTPDGDYVRK